MNPGTVSLLILAVAGLGLVGIAAYFEVRFRKARVDGRAPDHNAD